MRLARKMTRLRSKHVVRACVCVCVCVFVEREREPGWEGGREMAGAENDPAAK